MRKKLLAFSLLTVPLASVALPLTAIACGSAASAPTPTPPTSEVVPEAHTEAEYQAVKPSGALKLRFGVKMNHWTWSTARQNVIEDAKLIGSLYQSGNWVEWLIPYYDNVPEWLNDGKPFHPTTADEIVSLFKSQDVATTIPGDGYQGRDHYSPLPRLVMYFELPPLFPLRTIKDFYPTYKSNFPPSNPRKFDMRYLYGNFEWPSNNDPRILPNTMTITDLGNSFDVYDYDKGMITFNRPVDVFSIKDSVVWGELRVDVSPYGQVGS